MLLNTFHIEICSIYCIQFVLCMSYPFIEYKEYGHCAKVFIPIF